MNISTCFALAAALIASWAASPDARAGAGDRFNDTGITRCVDTAVPVGEPMRWTQACTGTGQDGEYGRDARPHLERDGAAGFKFTKVCHSGESAGEGACPANPAIGPNADDWGCTFDQVTGLTWEMKTNDFVSIHRRERAFSFDDGDDSALRFADEVNAAGLCGAADWRIPTVDELMSIVHFGAPRNQPSRQPPLIDKRYFPYAVNVGGSRSFYWALEDFHLGRRHGGVRFGTGHVELALSRETKRVRLVRSVVPVATRQMVVSDHGFGVKDSLTGLTWQRCLVGMRWTGTRCAGSASLMNWPQALDHANAVGGGWRLPNIKELVSASKLRISHRQAAAELFPGWGGGEKVWSATPSEFRGDRCGWDPGATRCVEAVDLTVVATSTELAQTAAAVWLVRADTLGN